MRFSSVTSLHAEPRHWALIEVWFGRNTSWAEHAVLVSVAPRVVTYIKERHTAALNGDPDPNLENEASLTFWAQIRGCSDQVPELSSILCAIFLDCVNLGSLI